jgi:DNA-binding NtrC family response regulator
MPDAPDLPRAGASTSSMQLSWDAVRTGAQSPHAGLVLLYSPRYMHLPPAYVLRAKECVIGRDEGVDIALHGRAVSRHHVRISQQGERWALADLGGRNGTIVNGELVGEIALEHLDEIRIGDVVLKFVEAGAEGYLGYRIDGAVVGEGAPPGQERIVGGYQIQRLATQLAGVATSELSVLLFGESGTGKEVFAQQLHERSGRRGPFQAVNCAALPPTLIEAELFGHRRGAFSGADRDRPGLIRAADGGTLFLDEIGDMPLDAQVKLLRVLQSKEVLPVGAVTSERVDVRIVCATHRDLRKLQQRDAFRGDLFARLNEYSVTLPPLRDRKEDLLSLCRAFAARHGRAEVRETFLFMVGLLHYDFPFNVRELEALIKRWIATSNGPDLDTQHLTDEIQEQMKSYGQSREAPAPGLQPADPPAELLATTKPIDPEERARLEEALRRNGGNVAATARALGMHRTHLRRLIERHDLQTGARRP